jgi:hypothetical protein
MKGGGGGKHFALVAIRHSGTVPLLQPSFFWVTQEKIFCETQNVPLSQQGEGNQIMVGHMHIPIIFASPQDVCHPIELLFWHESEWVTPFMQNLVTRKRTLAPVGRGSPAGLESISSEKLDRDGLHRQYDSYSREEDDDDTCGWRLHWPLWDSKEWSKDQHASVPTKDRGIENFVKIASRRREREWSDSGSSTRKKRRNARIELLGLPDVEAETMIHEIYYRVLFVSCKGKEGYPSVVFQVIASHTRKVLGVSGPYYGTWNDKTIARLDDNFQLFMAGGNVAADGNWTWTDDNAAIHQEKGLFLICDGGYHLWKMLICPFKDQPDGYQTA